MKWNELLSEKRSREYYGSPAYKTQDLRSEFEKDYHRIIGSASFRRLQDKTQVFPLDNSDFIRTRLTHSLEVSSIGKSLGQNIGARIIEEHKDSEFTWKMREDICHILQCAGLIHDIGNPPFGHFGETAIRDWFKENLASVYFEKCALTEVLTDWQKKDFYYFEGNAQALRLVSKLHYLVDENGMNLTYALLNTIVKYPVSAMGINKDTGNIKDKKMGYYFAEKEFFEEIINTTGTKGNRHPLTYILEAADDIAYKTADIEDAFVKKMLSYNQLCGRLKKIDEKIEGNGFRPFYELERQYKRGIEKQSGNPEEYAIKNWIIRVQANLIAAATDGFMSQYVQIMEGSCKKDIFFGTAAQELMEVLGETAFDYVFCSEQIYRMEIAESTMINFLMSRFIEAVIKFDTPETLTAVDKRMMSFVSENYKKAYFYHAEGKTKEEKLYLRLLLITDSICGMTDGYAKRLYQELNGSI